MDKGASWSIFISIMGSILALLVLSAVISQIFNPKTIDRLSSEEACILSNLQRMKYTVKVAGVDAVQPGNVFGSLNCKTISVPIEDKEQQKVAEGIGQLSGRCWEMFLQGRYDQIFSGASISNECFVCYTTNLVNVEAPIPGNLLFNMMKEVKYKPGGKFAVPVLDYIQSSGGPGSLIIADDLIFEAKKRTYAIAFVTRGGLPNYAQNLVGKVSLGLAQRSVREQNIYIDYLGNVEKYCTVVGTAGEI